MASKSNEVMCYSFYFWQIVPGVRDGIKAAKENFCVISSNLDGVAAVWPEDHSSLAISN